MIFQKLGVFGRIQRESDQFLRISGRQKAWRIRRRLRPAVRRTRMFMPPGIANCRARFSDTGQSNAAAEKFASGGGEHAARVGGRVRRVEKGMTWLATTGSVTPFIGLFERSGESLTRFSGLGSAGAASLRAVAPGISEALVTTAAGLFTAIPAVIFYNQFLGNIRDLGQRLDTFAMEVAAQVEKTFL